MWPHDRRRPEPPQFTPHDTLPHIRARGAEAPVELKSLEIEVVVNGLFAQTTQTLRFHNPNGRVLEGELTLPLAEGAVVCGYALDVDGQLVDGVIVPKQEARRILEAEIRKGVDPGLMEQVQGNLYRTRLYPLPAGGTRTVRITTVSQLTTRDSEAAYDLPLAHAAQIDTVSLRIEVVQATVQPEVGGLGNLVMGRWQDRWVAEARLGRGRPAADLQVRLPSLPDHLTTVERTPEGEVFFCVSSRLTQAEPVEWAPSRVALAWDASGSRSDIDRDLALLQALVARWPGLTVDVVVFRDRVEPAPTTFAAIADDGEALAAWLREQPRDGGTDLGALDLGTLPHPDCEAWLLFSDGQSTLGGSLPSLGSTPVFAVTSAAEGHGPLLGHLAAATGGAAVNLLRVPVDAACEAIATHQEPLRAGAHPGCADLHVHSAFGRRVVIGRRLEPTASVTLVGPGAPSEPVVLSAEAPPEGGLIARAWAGRQAQLTALLEGESAPALVELGRRYGLVTPGTSLLVLESLEQYLEYDLEPPASQPALRRAFLQQRRDTKEADVRSREDHIQTVLGWWRSRIEWWETDFRPHWGRVEPEEKAKRSAPHPPQMRRMASGATPPPSAPPAAPPDDLTMATMAEPAPEQAMELDEELHVAPKSAAPASTTATVSIQAWTPDVPYLAAMRRGSNAYAAYLEQRPAYTASPSFFLDCAGTLLDGGERDLGLRVLSNLAELGLDDPALHRIFAWRLQQAGELDRAVEVLERVLELREDEPQSHRDLALALGLRWERDGDTADVVRAAELLYEVVQRAWDRFPEIEVIALMELNRLVHLAGRRGVEIPVSMDPRLLRHLHLDVRISLSWDADLTDIDLHVFEPSGEHAYYAHNRTRIGGLVSRDFTQGYGPEEYVLRRAMPGDYTIKAHYYGSHQQSLTGPCTVIATVFTNYGRPDEGRQVLTLRLEQSGRDFVVGTITIGGAASPTESDPLAAFRALREGMTADEITAAVGQPARVRGGDAMALVYEPAPDVVVEVVLGPRLVAVRHLMDGAAVELV